MTPAVLTLKFVTTFNVYCNLTVTRNDIAITNFLWDRLFQLTIFLNCSLLGLKYGPDVEPAVDYVW